MLLVLYSHNGIEIFKWHIYFQKIQNNPSHKLSGLEIATYMFRKLIWSSMQWNPSETLDASTSKHPSTRHYISEGSVGTQSEWTIPSLISCYYPSKPNFIWLLPTGVLCFKSGRPLVISSLISASWSSLVLNVLSTSTHSPDNSRWRVLPVCCCPGQGLSVTSNPSSSSSSSSDRKVFTSWTLVRVFWIVCVRSGEPELDAGDREWSGVMTVVSAVTMVGPGGGGQWQLYKYRETSNAQWTWSTQEMLLLAWQTAPAVATTGWKATFLAYLMI